MPSVLDTAKEATYAAVGLNVLLLDDVNERLNEQRHQWTWQFNERFADEREQLDEQLDIAREHGQKALDRVKPLAQRTWEAYESAMTRVVELAPAPFDGYVNDSVARMKDFVGPEIAGTAEEAEQAAKKAAKAEKAEKAEKKAAKAEKAEEAAKAEKAEKKAAKAEKAAKADDKAEKVVAES